MIKDEGGCGSDHLNLHATGLKRYVDGSSVAEFGVEKHAVSWSWRKPPKSLHPGTTLDRQIGSDLFSSTLL